MWIDDPSFVHATDNCACGGECEAPAPPQCGGEWGSITPSTGQPASAGTSSMPDLDDVY
ncbi:hypothetical protein BO86DRAFT_390155 [Aspergillus japonicus CBS 114.51]|uniref:Uncharacterized protein n=1 Tax=Aspergillus japonicus CBS 114.51 TaxID=1448312 RepID=A0A8T8WZL8_ASPJA|nr:hypothetical protein BO86DRAFT_390155 [Aspergillus japonicus CBS 114.51]RAH80769.1 hypothetical protein BO86DRAFT_390155 [Aspergillus japonicus CBS 114.51]